MLPAHVVGDHKFTGIQVGKFGSASDVVVYANSELGRGMALQTLDMPQNEFIHGDKHLGKLPYTMLVDATFPFKPYLMRPLLWEAPSERTSHL